MDLEVEIDKIFIDEKEMVDCDEIQLITDYVVESKDFMEEISIFQQQVLKYTNVHEFYKLKLETLQRELSDIEDKNTRLDLSINNQRLVYDKIKELIKSVEIKPEHFENLLHPDFEDTTSTRVSLHILKKHTCNYKIKAVDDLKVKIKKTLKEFMKKFNAYFQKQLNQLESESRGELKIHGHVYNVVKSFEYIIEYCKEMEKENFVLISQKYISTAKSMYESEFEKHFDFVIRSLKDSKGKHKEKMEDIFGFVFESFLLILTSEEDFLKNYFHDDDKFLNSATLTIFSDVVEIMMDFLRDAHRINSVLTISAVYKNKDIEVQYKIKHLEIYTRFKNKVLVAMKDYEKQYIDEITLSWDYESKQKLIRRLVDGIAYNTNHEMCIELINTFTDKIVKCKKDSKRGKVEFEVYRHKLILMLETVILKENKNVMDNALKICKEQFEREIITYIFGTEQKNMTKRISNVLKVIEDYFVREENERIKMVEMVKFIVYDHINEEFKSEVEKLFV